MSAEGKEGGNSDTCPAIFQEFFTRGIALQIPETRPIAKRIYPLTSDLFWPCICYPQLSHLFTHETFNMLFLPKVWPSGVPLRHHWSYESYFSIWNTRANTCSSFIHSLFQFNSKILILQCVVLAREGRDIVRGSLLNGAPNPIVENLWVAR